MQYSKSCSSSESNLHTRQVFLKRRVTEWNVSGCYWQRNTYQNTLGDQVCWHASSGTSYNSPSSPTTWLETHADTWKISCYWRILDGRRITVCISLHRLRYACCHRSLFTVLIYFLGRGPRLPPLCGSLSASYQTPFTTRTLCRSMTPQSEESTHDPLLHNNGFTPFQIFKRLSPHLQP